MNLIRLIAILSLFLTVAPSLACDPLDQPRTRMTRPGNQVVDFNYDAGGRLQSLVLPDGTPSFRGWATINHVAHPTWLPKKDRQAPPQYEGNLRDFGGEE